MESGTASNSPAENDGNLEYKITTQTSGSYDASEPALKLFIELVGVPTGSDNDTLEATGFLQLEQFLGKDFQMGQLDNFIVSAKDVGFPKLIRLKIKNDQKTVRWFCNYVEIGIIGRLKKANYPVYDCVEAEMTVLEGTASLPQNVTNNYVKSARQAEVERSKVVYEWVPEPLEQDIGWGLPRHVNSSSYGDLPPMFQRQNDRWVSFYSSAFESLLDETGLELFKKDITLTSFNDYKNLYKNEKLPMDNPDYFDNWKSDETIGRQVLTGICPLVINPCPSPKALPEYFKVTNADVSGLLEKGKTLKDEMKAGKIYIVDYKPLTENIQRNPDLHCANSTGLFYAKNSESFVPIAIQHLVPEDSQLDCLFTANDSPEAWLQAKMYFRTSMSSIHEWVYHFLYTHNVMEPFAVALFRCFPKCHPIYKLLRPHLQTVSAINADARNILIPPGSGANKALSLSALDTARRFFEKFQFDDIVIPKVFAKKGMSLFQKKKHKKESKGRWGKSEKDVADDLPQYYYRHDALALWQIMDNFVTNVITYYYLHDKDVGNDSELQDWINDVTTNGINWQYQNPGRVPEVKTIPQLIEICVTLMFTCSAQHAAVNFGQFETYKFVPNSPTCMRKPPQKKTETITETSILERLPNVEQAGHAIMITFLLSGYSPDDVFIGQFPENLFSDEEIIKMQLDYSKELEEFEAQLVARNAKLPKESRYMFLIPGRVPRNIAI